MKGAEAIMIALGKAKKGRPASDDDEPSEDEEDAPESKDSESDKPSPEEVKAFRELERRSRRRRRRARRASAQKFHLRVQGVLTMSFSFLTQPKDRFAGVMSFADLTEAARWHYAIARRRTQVLISDAATAATTVTETGLASMSAICGGIVRQVTVVFPIAVTASNSTYATITVSKRTAGGSKATVATCTTQITDPTLGGNAVAFVEYTIPLTVANVILAASDTLQVEVAKASTGVALTAATSYVRVMAEIEETAT